MLNTSFCYRIPWPVEHNAIEFCFQNKCFWKNSQWNVWWFEFQFYSLSETITFSLFLLLKTTGESSRSTFFCTLLTMGTLLAHSSGINSTFRFIAGAWGGALLPLSESTNVSCGIRWSLLVKKDRCLFLCGVGEIQSLSLAGDDLYLLCPCLEEPQPEFSLSCSNSGVDNTVFLVLFLFVLVPMLHGDK